MTSRRSFIRTLGAGAAALGGLTACGGGGGSTSPGGGGNPPPPPPPAVSGPILVVIQVQGGNDWLNTLPPLTGANAGAYRSNRPAIGIPESELTPLNMAGTGDVGLNKDMLGMDVLHAAGKVAWIPGIGMPNPNLSHFTSTDLWGQGAAVPDGSGWLGRWGDAVFAPSDILRGIAVTSDIMLMVHGKKRDFVSVVNTSDFVYPAYLRSTATPPDANFLKTGFLASLNGAAGDPAAGLAASEGKLWYDAQATFSTLIKARTPSVAYPGDASFTNPRNLTRLSSQLSSQLKLVAQMIASGIPCQVYTVRLGGFDTHSNEATDYPRLMGALGGSIKAFHDDLATIDTTVDGKTVKAQDRVLMMAWSEFGRRIKENNGGTDHGTSVLCFCAGNMVRGGFYGGGYPDLTKPDANGNMVSTSDFRGLYATLLDKFLGGDSKAVLGATYTPLGFLG
ncbi:MAG: DUF1501 domain-containing protein [Acidobacteria bacterium]|nr:DUF1501 domain-containing protein [Acidobacteriota bacterium]